MSPEDLGVSKKRNKLHSFDISKAKLLNKGEIFVGAIAKKLIGTNKGSTSVQAFLTHVEDGFVACAKVLQSKMPLDSPLLRALAFVDPRTIGNSHSLKYLLALPKLVTNVFSDEQDDSFNMEKAAA